LPYLSNATDFDALAAEPSLEVAFADHPHDLACADVVMLPGTKDTLGARRWLRERGFDDALRAVAHDGRIVVGICGGLQVLGTHISDPHGVEGGGAEPGLGLLDVATELAREKITELVRVRPFASRAFDVATHAVAGDGYEIHMGRTHGDAAPFGTILRRDGTVVEDGARDANGCVVGTYVHGIFASDDVRHAFVRGARAARGLRPAVAYAEHAAEREARIDRLATHVRASLDLATLLA
jgi:adenosylcobyric acid synthase